MADYMIHTDGASRGNPGDAAYSFVVRKDGLIIKEESATLGTLTNNQAEYRAMVEALRFLSNIDPNANAIIHSDSELMVKQIRGEYKVKSEDIKPLHREVASLLGIMKGNVRVVHVRREQNKDADRLCNEALDGLR
ncbi:MAG: ribonuclease HI family protein [Gemmataceae bacterium]|jgi:ribonuclease HI